MTTTDLGQRDRICPLRLAYSTLFPIITTAGLPVEEDPVV